MGPTTRLLLLIAVLLLQLVTSETHLIYWNISNPLFKRDYEISVRLGDQIKMVCPQLKDKYEDDEGAYLIIQKDSEMAHMNCLLESPREVALCTRPLDVVPVMATTSIRRFHPRSGVVTFEPGQTHFFLSTSSGSFDGMDKKMEGICKHYNMRLKIHVEEAETTVAETTTRTPVTYLPPSRILNPSDHKKRPHHSKEEEREKKQRKERMEENRLKKFSESDIPELYRYQTSEEARSDPILPPEWDTVKMAADEIVGDFRGGYQPSMDYIISENSSSTTTYTLFIIPTVSLLMYLLR